jgi:glucose dehydrogenase
MEPNLSRIKIRSARLILAFAAASLAYAQKDWPTFGHDLAGTRYSTLKQIDASNVTRLARVWTYHMNAVAPQSAVAAPSPGSSDAGDAVAGGPPGGRGRGGPPGGGIGGSEVSPLVIDGVMYTTTGGGKEIWAYTVEQAGQISADRSRQRAVWYSSALPAIAGFAHSIRRQAKSSG